MTEFEKLVIRGLRILIISLLRGDRTMDNMVRNYLNDTDKYIREP